MRKDSTISYSEEIAKKILDQYLNSFKVLDNFRPNWLEGMEIDRFYPSLGIAIEYQGDQHFREVPGMHQDSASFQRQLETDQRKRNLLEQKGIKLYAINFLDIDRFKIKHLVGSIVEDAKSFTKKNNNQLDFNKLHSVRVNMEPDASLMREADKIAHTKKTYRSNKKIPWWVKLIRKI